MRYILASRAKAINVGFSTIGHRTKLDKIILNEKEVNFNQILQGTLKERVENLNGSIQTETEILKLINEGDWNYE